MSFALTSEAQKGESRKEVRTESGFVDEEWGFLFETVYQSTDETDPEETVDPGTDTSSADEPQVSTARRDWITRPPTYRNTGVR